MEIKIFCRCSLFPSWSVQVIRTPGILYSGQQCENPTEYRTLRQAAIPQYCIWEVRGLNFRLGHRLYRQFPVIFVVPSRQVPFIPPLRTDYHISVK